MKNFYTKNECLILVLEYNKNSEIFYNTIKIEYAHFCASIINITLSANGYNKQVFKVNRETGKVSLKNET